jgi:hypothetical protein
MPEQAGSLPSSQGAFSIFYVAMGGFYILMAQLMKGQANFTPIVGLFFTIMGFVFGPEGLQQSQATMQQ